MGKVDASIAVASVMFNKSPYKQTYRARAIREWTAYYLKHGELRPFRRGKFAKTFTIISNEAEVLRASHDSKRKFSNCTS